MKRAINLNYTIILYIPFLLLTLLFGFCKKENSLNNSILSPFKVKYEIITSNPVSTSIGTGLSISYTNSTGALSKSLNNNSAPWNHEEIITETNRPLQLKLNTGPVALKEPGTVTANIYINGIKKASFFTTTSTTTSIGGYNIATLNAEYWVH